MKNVERHATARHVAVRLGQPGAFVKLAIQDDGIGFDPDRRPATRKDGSGFGLLSMRERATYVGGVLEVTSVARGGTKIAVRIPFGPAQRGRVRAGACGNLATGSGSKTRS